VAKLSERQRLWLTIGVSALATGGVTFLVFSDRTKIHEAEDEIAALDQRIEAADVEIRQTKDREDKVIVFRHVQSRELEILPQRQQIADFHSALTTFLEQAGASFSKLPESAPKESELARGIYVTPNTVEFTADARSLLGFMNMIENDPRLVAVKGLKVKGGTRKPSDKKELPIVHEAELHLETYYYAPPSDARRSVVIPNEEERLEEPGIRTAIAAFQPERRGSYTLKPAAGRRDPFVDVRREEIIEDPEAVRKRFESEEGVAADLERRHDEIREKAEAEKALFAAGDLFRRDRLAQEVDTLVNELRVRLSGVASVKSVTFPDLLGRVEKVRVSIEDIASGRKDLPRELTITVPVAEQTRDQIAKAFQAGDYQEVGNVTTAWETFLRGKAVEDAVQPYLEEIKTYRKRAKTLQDFKSKSIHVTGVVFNPQRPSLSVALVNGKVLRIGDALDDKGDVRVSGITRESVEFSYEGETVKVRRQEAGRERAPLDGSPGSAPARHGQPR
jgi:hypothetical protein